MKLGGAFPPWSADEDSRLAALWAEGLSANAIAARLPGRNRNAVTGRALRLGLPRRPSPIPHRTKAQALRAAAWQRDADEAYARAIAREARP